MEGYYTIKSIVPKMTHNTLCKYNKAGDVDWFMENSNWWSREPYWDRYFTDAEINNLEPVLRAFVLSEFCEVTQS